MQEAARYARRISDFVVKFLRLGAAVDAHAVHESPIRAADAHAALAAAVGRPASAVFTSRTPHTIHEEDSVADSLDDNVIPAEVGEPSLRQQEHALRHHARWESQHARQAQSLCKAGGRAPDQLLMLTGHQAREKAELLQLLHKAKPFNERNGAASFAMSMRNCHERWESVGGPLSGLWTSTKEPRNIFGDFQVHRMPELRTGALSRSRPQSAQLAPPSTRGQQAAFVHRPGSGRPGSGRTSSSGRSRPMSASAAAGAGARHSIGGAQAAHKRSTRRRRGRSPTRARGRTRRGCVGCRRWASTPRSTRRASFAWGRVHIHDAVEAEAAAARAAAEEEAAASRAAAAAREERRAERAAAEAAAAAEKAAAAARWVQRSHSTRNVSSCKRRRAAARPPSSR